MYLTASRAAARDDGPQGAPVPPSGIDGSGSLAGGSESSGSAGGTDATVVQQAAHGAEGDQRPPTEPAGHLLSSFLSLKSAARWRHNVKLERGPMPNVMVALPNIGGALCSTPHSLARATGRLPCSNAANRRAQDLEDAK